MHQPHWNSLLLQLGCKLRFLVIDRAKTQRSHEELLGVFVYGYESIDWSTGHGAGCSHVSAPTRRQRRPIVCSCHYRPQVAQIKDLQSFLVLFPILIPQVLRLTRKVSNRNPDSLMFRKHFFLKLFPSLSLI